MASKEEGHCLSPRTRVKFSVLLQALQTGKAQLEEDSLGRIKTVYANERTIPLSHVDKSKAHRIQVGKNARDIELQVEAFLEMIDAIKQCQAPSGVVIDETKVVISAQGQYRKGLQFIRTKEVLGKGNCAGDIVIVQDVETETEHAMKTVMISVFSSNEVRAWVALGDSDRFPSLYLFRLDGNKVVFHMEKVEHGVTLTEFIDSCMPNLREKAPELTRPFSLCIFHGLLSAVREMHDKNWAHRDLHGGNVMITKDTLMLKILDFGTACPLGEGTSPNHGALKNDILNVIRLFCGVYIGQDFGNNFILESKIKAGMLKKMLPETKQFSKEQREELLRLIEMMYEVTQNPKLEGYGSTVPVTKQIEEKLSPDEMKDVREQAAPILFPDFYGNSRDIALGEKGEEEEVDETTDDLNQEASTQPLSDDLLRDLNINRGEDA